MTPTPNPNELRGTLRIDTEPGAKRFQGVFLDANGKKYVIDYRRRWLWVGFENGDVIVTGHCYAPKGQAVMAPHFHVDTMTFATRPKRSEFVLGIGPEIELAGRFFDHVYPAGSKRAGDTEHRFEADGVIYEVFANDIEPNYGKVMGPTMVRARVLEVDLAHHAMGSEPKLWIGDVIEDNHEPAPPAIPCG